MNTSKYALGLVLPGVREASEREACLLLAFSGFLSKRYPEIFVKYFVGHLEDVDIYTDIIMNALWASSLDLKEALLPLTEHDCQQLVLLFQEDSPLDSFTRYEEEFVDFIRSEC